MRVGRIQQLRTREILRDAVDRTCDDFSAYLYDCATKARLELSEIEISQEKAKELEAENKQLKEDVKALRVELALLERLLEKAQRRSVGM